MSRIQSRQRARRLSMIAAGLMAFTAGAGLLNPGVYRDNAFVTAGWFGNDLVTLMVATPLLLIAVRAARERDLRSDLVWLGMLDYVLYNYAFYLFGAAFNAFFLLYVALFTLAVFALAFGVAALDVAAVEHVGLSRAQSRGVGLFLLIVVVLGLGGFHVGIAIGALVSGTTPALVATVGHPTNIIAALDLSLVVSVGALAAFWLWRGEPWGYVLAAISTVKGAVYMLALSAATISGVQAGAADDWSAIGLWGSIGLGCAAAAWTLLRTPRAGRVAEGGVA